MNPTHPTDYRRLKAEREKRIVWLRENQVRFFNTERGFMEDITEAVIHRYEQQMDEWDHFIRAETRSRKQSF